MVDVQVETSYLLSKLDELINAPKQDFDDPKIDGKVGVYCIYDKDELIYVGQSTCLRRRLLSDHRSGNVDGSAFRKVLGKINGWNEAQISDHIINNCSFRYILDDNPRRIEHFAIAVLKPKLNK